MRYCAGARTSMFRVNHENIIKKKNKTNKTHGKSVFSRKLFQTKFVNRSKSTRDVSLSRNVQYYYYVLQWAEGVCIFLLEFVFVVSLNVFFYYFFFFSARYYAGSWIKIVKFTRGKTDIVTKLLPARVRRGDDALWFIRFNYEPRNGPAEDERGNEFIPAGRR